MDIYQFAKQMEKDGENYYRQLAAASKISGLKKIFLMLADEEVKHYNLIEQLQTDTAEPEFQELPLLENAKNVFTSMRQSGEELHVDTNAETEAYRKALDIEDQSIAFYRQKAEETANPTAKNLLQRLAAEERKHLRIMETIVDFVSKPEPGNWLENAEWHHLEEY